MSSALRFLRLRPRFGVRFFEKDSTISISIDNTACKGAAQTKRINYINTSSSTMSWKVGLGSSTGDLGDPEVLGARFPTEKRYLCILGPTQPVCLCGITSGN